MPRKAVESAVRMRSLNLKTTERLRADLEEAARSSGRALTHEVERRLDQSFALQAVDQNARRIGDLIALSITMSRPDLSDNKDDDENHKALRRNLISRYQWRRASLLLARVMGVLPISELHESVRAASEKVEAQANEDDMREAAASDSTKGALGRLLESMRPLKTVEELRREVDIMGDGDEDGEPLSDPEPAPIKSQKLRAKR